MKSKEVKDAKDNKLPTKPDYIHIMGKKFTITYPGDIDSDVYGTCDGAERKIELSPRIKGVQFEDTLLHEIIHGILYMSGNTQKLSTEREESIVIALETGLSVLYERRKDGPWII